MPQTSPLTCSNLIPLYHTWGDEIQVAKKLFDVFVKDGTQEARKEVEAILKTAEGERDGLLNSCDEPAVFVDSNGAAIHCIKLEQLGLETIKYIFGGNIVPFMESNGSKITRLNFINLSSVSTETMNLAVSFISLFDSLTRFDCYNNANLTSLQDLPSSLTRFDCFGNQNLTSLPDIPSSVTILICSSNANLTSLPELPDSLTELYCLNNPKLISLPKLPNSLTKIDVRNTPAAKNPETIAQLDEFERLHPGVTIIR